MDEERIKFPKGKQKEFIQFAKKKSNLNWKQFAKILGFKYNKLLNLCKENYRLSKNDFRIICDFIKIKQDTIFEQFNGKEISWSPLIALLKIKKKRMIGTSINKQNKTNILFNRKNLEIDLSNMTMFKKDILLPNKITPLLAYEIGTNIGDGCIPTRGKGYRLKGNNNDEKEYYQNIIKPMFKKLYNIDLNLKEFKSAYGFECYSKALINFKTRIIGLPMGSKKNIQIPSKLKVKNEKILCSLIGGIFDTDGTIYFKSQGKNKNYYPTLRITTISILLAKDIQEILKMLGFNTYLFKNQKISKRTPNPRFDIILNGYNNFNFFMDLIGTKQPKNIDKINNWRNNWPNLVKMADVY